MHHPINSPDQPQPLHEGKNVLELGSRRELFVDRFLIERLDQNLSLRLHSPVDGGVAFVFDQPWEGPYSGYPTVIRDGDRLLLYYRAQAKRGQEAHGSQSTCVAESTDGRQWIKPRLNGGEKNIVIGGNPTLSNNFTPFFDQRPGVPANERYKATAGWHRDGGLYALVSGDGLEWRKWQEEPIVPGVPEVIKFDSQNVASWSQAEQCYVLYYRTARKAGADLICRWVTRATSLDFSSWETQGEMNYESGTGQLYVNQTSPYFRAPHIHLATAARFMPERQVVSLETAEGFGLENAESYIKSCSDVVLLSTRGGLTYQREFHEALVRPGLGPENWTARSNFPGVNLVQTGESEMSAYVVRRFGQSQSHLQRYAWRLDGLSSLHAGSAGGTMVTKPFTFSGSRLELNYSTSVAGGLRVEILDESGWVVPGFGEAPDRAGDEIAGHYRWVGEPEVASLAGRRVRLRITLTDGDIYSLRFCEATREGLETH